MAATDDRADDARFRWCAESLWPVQRWAASRPPARVEAFAERVREGRIELSAMPFNLHTEACSTTELFELLRGARDVAEAWGVPLVSAMQTDVPGAVGALPDALGEAGVRYLSVAHNWAGRSVPTSSAGQSVPRLFRWRGPAGHEVLVWRTDTPTGSPMRKARWWASRSRSRSSTTCCRPTSGPSRRARSRRAAR